MYFFKLFSLVWHFTINNLEEHYTQAVVVRLKTRYLAGLYLWRDVAWCPALLVSLALLVFKPADPKICYPQISLLIKEQVFGLDVQMYDFFLPNVNQTQNDTSGNEPHIVFS